MTTGFVWHELYAWHDTGMATSWVPTGPPAQPEPHVESPASKRRLRGLIEVSGLLGGLRDISPRPASNDELLRMHTPEYIDRIEALSDEAGGDAGESTPFGRGSAEIARLAVGGCLEGVDAVLGGEVENAYALVRPPGHHAESDMGRGFCLFGNSALAALHARQAGGLERVAIVDWDVHHGNGTEHAFYEDPSVLAISLHQDNLYPAGSGAVEDTGTGDGEGFNVNIPLPPGCGTGAYEHAFDRVVEPALRAFDPDLIIVACGFDAGAMDPLGRMILTSDDFRNLTRRLLGVATDVCGGRLVMCHEGGYSSAYVPFCGLAVLEELSGQRTGTEDPFLEALSGVAWRGLQPHQEEAIAKVAGKLEMGELGATT